MRENAVGLPVAGDERDRSANLGARAAATGRGERLQQQVGLAMSGEASQANDLTRMGDQFLTVGLAIGPYADPDRRIAAGIATAHGLDARRLGRDPAHRSDQTVPIERRGEIRYDHLAVAHDGDAVAIVQNLAEDVGDQCATHASSNRISDIAEQLARGLLVERRGRLVEDHEPRRPVGDREGARDFDHLPSPDR